MGVALELAAQNLLATPPLARRAAARAVPLLETAVRDRPDDLRARDSLGYALGMLDRLEDARRVYEEVLRIEPNRELVLPYLARTLSGLRRPDLAAETLREVIAVNPWRSDYRLTLAQNCCQGRRLGRCRGSLSRGAPAQPRAGGGAVAAGPGLPRRGRAGEGRGRVPGPAPLPTPPPVRPGSSGMRSRRNRDRERRGVPPLANPDLSIGLEDPPRPRSADLLCDNSCRILSRSSRRLRRSWPA